MENSASRTRSAVGRVRAPRGAARRRPRNSPATTLMRRPPGAPATLASRRDRVVVRPEPGHDRLAQQRMLRLLQAGVLEQDRVGAVAGANEQLGVLGQLRHAELGQAVLARAEHVAGAAQLEVDLGEPEAVALVRDRLEAREPRVAEQDAERSVLAAADAPAKLVQL